MVDEIDILGQKEKALKKLDSILAAIDEIKTKCNDILLINEFKKLYISGNEPDVSENDKKLFTKYSTFFNKNKEKSNTDLIKIHNDLINDCNSIIKVVLDLSKVQSDKGINIVSIYENIINEMISDISKKAKTAIFIELILESKLKGKMPELSTIDLNEIKNASDEILLILNKKRNEIQKVRDFIEVTDLKAVDYENFIELTNIILKGGELTPEFMETYGIEEISMEGGVDIKEPIMIKKTTSDEDKHNTKNSSCWQKTIKWLNDSRWKFWPS